MPEAYPFSQCSVSEAAASSPGHGRVAIDFTPSAHKQPPRKSFEGETREATHAFIMMFSLVVKAAKQVSLLSIVNNS